MALLPLPMPSSCVYILAQTTCRGPSLTCSEGISIGGCAYVTRPRGYSLTPFTFLPAVLLLSPFVSALAGVLNGRRGCDPHIPTTATRRGFYF